MCRSLSRWIPAPPPLPEPAGRGAGTTHTGSLALHIRRTRVADAAYLPALERDAAQAFCAIPGLEWLAEGDVLPPSVHLASIATQTCWVGANAKGQLRGFLSATPYGNDLHIQEMSVALAAQGQGLGRRLLHAACKAGQLLGLRRVTLTTFANVPWNAPFYASAGFCIVPPNALDARLASVLALEESTVDWPPPRAAPCSAIWHPPFNVFQNETVVPVKNDSRHHTAVITERLPPLYGCWPLHVCYFSSH
ncbi:GNAT family N-acetyltransferase [Acetobacter lambici]|uniref:GNAT family N-acetyltransferase n=1 Tax=Acetobacter lambici TaxID=1332824 RepID=A0ABT1EZX8_9PROT|nr:GNAT family N-acetyltransferase [Acetobacter lambici]MCP1243211.1 GNAT family N-acetyltransferase [Acetobacter lambici]MCP1258497.1 GNAT family N-acetyltransferase [Acetobacter lambici]